MRSEKENLTALFFTLLTLLTLSANAKTDSRLELAVSHIDQQLLHHAGAVVRAHDLEINVEDKERVFTKRHVIITVMNEGGSEYGRISEGFSKSEKIQALEGAVFDKDGNLLRKISRSDLLSRPAVMNIAFYDDWRIARYEFTTKQYPYTIEYTIEKKQSFTYFLPQFEPQPGEDCAVERASLTVIMPQNNELKFKSINVGNPTIEKGTTQNKYSWQVQSLKATSDEPLSFNHSGYNAAVLLACRDFSYEGYTGSQDSWTNFGKFSYALNKDRDELPPHTKEAVHSLTSKLTTDREKIEALYKYLQQNTRYVAIEYGIGGWQTLDANSVAKYQYGDCKGLTNFMMSLLKEAGITAYHTLIEAGDDKGMHFFEDMPMSQFNHVILCIPQHKDTLWLECTSNDLPVNYLGDFTQDRRALLITSDGGKLVRTPKYGSDANCIVRYARMSDMSEEATKIAFTSTMTGELADWVFRNITNASATDIDQFLHSKFHLSGYSIDKHEYTRKDTIDKFIMKERITISAPNMVSTAGKVTFVNSDPAPLDLRSYVVVKDRRTDFLINDSYTITDSFEIDIPRNLKLTQQPSDAEMAHPFGQYTRTFTVADSKVIIRRRFVQHRGVFKPELYNTYVKWIDAIKKDNEQKLVLEAL